MFSYNKLLMVPNKAVAEVVKWKIYSRGELVWRNNSRANPLMGWKVVEYFFCIFGHLFTEFASWLSTYLIVDLNIYRIDFFIYEVFNFFFLSIDLFFYLCTFWNYFSTYRSMTTGIQQHVQHKIHLYVSFSNPPFLPSFLQMPQ